VEERYCRKDQEVKYFPRISCANSIALQTTGKPQAGKGPPKTQRTANDDTLPWWEVLNEKLYRFVHKPIHLISLQQHLNILQRITANHQKSKGNLVRSISLKCNF
jgi:hypothetical protein